VKIDCPELVLPSYTVFVATDCPAVRTRGCTGVFCSEDVLSVATLELVYGTLATHHRSWQRLSHSTRSLLPLLCHRSLQRQRTLGRSPATAATFLEIDRRQASSRRSSRCGNGALFYHYGRETKQLPKSGQLRPQRK